MGRTLVRRARVSGVLSVAGCSFVLALALGANAAPTCPLAHNPAIDPAKPNKLYLFFPSADDAGFPENGCTVNTASCFDGAGADAGNISPAQRFDVSELTTYTGSAADLMNRVHDVVVDDYCEFNVQVLQTTTVPPTTFPNRVTTAIGTDRPTTSGLYGIARDVDSGDAVAEDYARAWAGTNLLCQGSGTACNSSLGDGNELVGANATLERWAFAIAGTAAHEAGHTFGLSHGHGATVLPGEPAISTHIMPSGGNIPYEQRVGIRRHFGDTEYSVLAANVGLSLQTLHNWDLVNPNSSNAESLRIEVLSTSAALNVSWAYDGSLSPWINPTVSGPTGTRDFHGTTYNVFNIDWTADHAWDGGSAGLVPPAGTFHVGIAFTEVDFATPNAVIVTNTTLFNGSGAALTLHPRLIGYDAGTLDADDGDFDMRFFDPSTPGADLQVSDVQIFELPRMAAINTMISGGQLASYDGVPVTPWVTSSPEGGFVVGDSQPVELNLAALRQGRHIFQRHDGICSPPPTGGTGGQGNAGGTGGGTGGIVIPDSDDPNSTIGECIAKGHSLDLFPSTTVLVSAKVTDPAATHFNPATGTFVTGPLSTRIFFQAVGRHPDFNRNEVDDAIDIDEGTSVDGNTDGVPDEVQQCLTELGTLEQCELTEGNLVRKHADVVRQEGVIDACVAQGGDFSCCPVPVSACVIGTTSLDMRDRVRSVGNVGTDNLTLGANASVGGAANVFGNALLRNNARINAALDIKGTLTTQTGATVGGPISKPGISAQSVLPNDVVTAGTTPLTVNNDQTRTVLPGSYGAALFRARSRVTLNAGTYNFASLTIEGPSNVTLNTSGGPIVINVKGNVVINSGTAFAGADATKVRLYSTGTSVSLQPGVGFPGTIVAPLATLSLASFVTIGGCLGGKVVSIDTDSRINGTGFVSGGKLACETRKSELNTQKTQLEQQISQQTLVCEQNETSFRTCTGVPAPTGAQGMLRMQARSAASPAPRPEANVDSADGSGLACSLSPRANGRTAWLALVGLALAGVAAGRRIVQKRDKIRRS